jgi:hypothetical protein
MIVIPLHVLQGPGGLVGTVSIRKETNSKQSSNGEREREREECVDQLTEVVAEVECLAIGPVRVVAGAGVGRGVEEPPVLAADGVVPVRQRVGVVGALRGRRGRQDDESGEDGCGRHGAQEPRLHGWIFRASEQSLLCFEIGVGGRLFVEWVLCFPENADLTDGFCFCMRTAPAAAHDVWVWTGFFLLSVGGVFTVLRVSVAVNSTASYNIQLTSSTTVSYNFFILSLNNW